MRFAWLQKNSANHVPVKESLPGRLIFIVYNVVWWIPMVLVIAKIIDPRAGFLAFFVITLIRAIANLIRNNVLTLEQAEIFPFRAP
jgi:hypothetical protein